MSAWMPEIETERTRFGYVARTCVSLSIGSPYRSMFCYWWQSISRRARSEDKAVAKCKAKAEAVARADREWREKKHQRTRKMRV